MAVTQISRIQHRRGLQQDLPQLASAELGWSVDQRRLFIGNGTLEEGAPTVGVTEILTEYSDINQLITTYTFKGEAAGYIAQTGSSELNPITRSFQQKLDDFVNVRDFGVIGDGITDDTAAINRAIREIYKSTVTTVEARTRRKIYFPAGTYLTSNTIQVPPNAHLVGDGINNAIIKQTQGNKSVVEFCDTAFLTGSNIGSTGATTPGFNVLDGFYFTTSNTSISQPIFKIDSASNIKITNTRIEANINPGSYPNLVQITSTVSPTRLISFDNVIFNRAGNGICISGANVQKIRIANSYFENISNTSIDGGTVYGLTSVNNFHSNVGSSGALTFASNFYSIGDTINNSFLTGIFLGNLNIGIAKSAELTTDQPLLYDFIANSSGSFTYEISNSSARRFGKFNFVVTNTNIIYDDEYTETPTPLFANLTANVSGLTCSLNSGTGTFKYNLTKFF